MLVTEGHELISKLLQTLQTYKSLNAVDAARDFYTKYSKVPKKMAGLVPKVVQ